MYVYGIKQRPELCGIPYNVTSEGVNNVGILLKKPFNKQYPTETSRRKTMYIKSLYISPKCA